MRNLMGCVQRRVVARGALLFCIVGGIGVAHTQTASPGSLRRNRPLPRPRG
jgi:hypothetical protein